MFGRLTCIVHPFGDVLWIFAVLTPGVNSDRTPCTFQAARNSILNWRTRSIMATTSSDPIKISVGFTQQQWELIDRLKAEGRWGTSRQEVVRNVFRDYVKQELGE
jgi:hypothetical protein